MKQMQISDLTPKALREAVKKGENVVLFDGGDPVAQLLVGGAELKRRKEFFVHYPHDAAECFNSCWRHDGSAEAETAAADELVPAGT